MLTRTMLTDAKIRHHNMKVEKPFILRSGRIGGGVWSLLVVGLLCFSCSSRQRAAPETLQPRNIGMTRVVRIPATNDIAQSASAQSEMGKLVVTLGSADELPEGPDGFDVTANGAYLITDPLRKRIAVFDGNGAYRSEWQIGFAADSVTILSDNLVQVREAKTGELHLFNLEGKPASGNTTTAEPGEARLTAPNTAIVTWAAATGRQGAPLEIDFDKAGLKMLSVQPIAMESSGIGYVAIESTAGGDSVDLKKTVRRYGADGKVIAETTELPLDYFVRPTDEIRVRKGVVYQLMTTMSEVRINVWNTN